MAVDSGFLQVNWTTGALCNTTNPSDAVTLIPDNQVFYSICFEAIGILWKTTLRLSFCDYPTDMDVKRFNSLCQDIGEVTYDGFLSIGTEPLVINISSADGFQGDEVCVQLTVENF